MKKGLIGATLVLLICIGFFGVAYPNTYALYYTCARNQDTHLVIMNSGGSDTYYTLKVYDAYGDLLDATSGDLTPFESDYQILSDLAGNGDTSWGLALIETPAILTIGVETFEEGYWRASDNIVDAVPEDSGSITYYWYGLNYSNTSSQSTGIAIVNPNGFPAAATVFIYDSYGNLKETFDIVLDPHETDYYNSMALVALSQEMWGIVDVKATVPIVIAAEYISADDVLLNVDQIAHFYYSE
jgi:hypothetical protein